MKITKRQLRRIIREERTRLLKEMHPRAAADDALVNRIESFEQLVAELRSTNIDWDQGRGDDEIFIMTPDGRGVTVKVMRRGR